MKKYSLFFLCMCGLGITGWAAPDLAPAVPDLNLPAEEEDIQSVPMLDMEEALRNQPQPVPEKKPVTSRKHTRKSDEPVIAVTMKDLKNDEVMVEKMNPVLPPIERPAVLAEEPAVPAQIPQPAEKAQESNEKPAVIAPIPAEEAFAPAREEQAEPAPKQNLKIAYNPGVDRDPTLSPDDTLLLKHREEERLRAIEAEKQRKLEEERRRLAELERQRQLELERLRDPSKEIRGKIRISGIIGQEVFIGDKVYTVGKTVLGARIISVQPDSVVFMYKGQKFTKKVQLQ